LREQSIKPYVHKVDGVHKDQQHKRYKEQQQQKQPNGSRHRFHGCRGGVRSQTPTNLVNPGKQPGPLLRQIVLVRLNAYPAQIQSVAIQARLKGGAMLNLTHSGTEVCSYFIDDRVVFKKY